MIVALVAAVGDQISVVRQKESVGSHLEPFTRRSVPVNGPTLDMAVLRGLDRGVTEEDPQAQRVLLRWTAPAETLQAMADTVGSARDALILAALRKHLAALPERAQWDRIEAILPKHFRREIKGMGSKLTGVGIYIQPLKSEQFEMDENGLTASPTEADGNHRTIDPKTGARGKASTYVAPYICFERITLDAATLEVRARKPQFDNTKFNDPNAAALDVFQHLPIQDLLGRLLVLAERSAYQSVRGKDSTVNVGPLRELPASSPTSP